MSKLAISLIAVLSIAFAGVIADSFLLRHQLQNNRETIANLESQITILQNSNKTLFSESAKIKEESERIKSIKPDMPVSISFRSAMMGPGLVAIISTTIKKPLPVIATFSNPSLGRTKKMELHLSANSSTEIGHAEGVILESGDTITIENKNFSPVTFTVSN